MKPQTIINAVVAVIALLCAVICITDLAPRIFGISSATFGMITVLGVLPICIGLSDLAERMHPELFSDDDLKRKGRK